MRSVILKNVLMILLLSMVCWSSKIFAGQLEPPPTAVDPSGNPVSTKIATLESLSCSSNQVPVWNGSSWMCAPYKGTLTDFYRECVSSLVKLGDAGALFSDVWNSYCYKEDGFLVGIILEKYSDGSYRVKGGLDEYKSVNYKLELDSNPIGTPCVVNNEPKPCVMFVSFRADDLIFPRPGSDSTVQGQRRTKIEIETLTDEDYSGSDPLFEWYTGPKGNSLLRFQLVDENDEPYHGYIFEACSPSAYTKFQTLLPNGALANKSLLAAECDFYGIVNLGSNSIYSWLNDAFIGKSVIHDVTVTLGSTTSTLIHEYLQYYISRFVFLGFNRNDNVFSEMLEFTKATD